MRIFFTSILLLYSFLSNAQLSKEEIKKYHIYKIIEKFFEGETLEEKTASYFDKQGNILKETAGNDTAITTREYQYESERVKKIIDHEFGHTTEYFYEPDGSYLTITTDKRFGAKNYSWHRPNGDIIKAFGGDTIFYKYNELGKLQEIKTDSGKQVKFHVKFIYNPKGQLEKVENPTDEFNNLTETYTYNLHGKRIKATTKTNLHGMTRTNVSKYKYNKKGFLIRETTVHRGERGDKFTTRTIYEYEFYKD
ncbi:MAG TPA: hypothetical protein VFP97_16110 [Chitinophagaceae bacterium]|nr:hypothetical protein [Chitinophagaceae bacterium]